MPSFDILLVIAREFLKKNKSISNHLDFIYGNIKLDLTVNKALSHYTGPQDKNNLIEYFENKVRIDEYIKK